MISAIGSLGSINSAYQVYSADKSLSAQTKYQLESAGIDTTNITTESQGQTALQCPQNVQDTQQTQGIQQSQPACGGNSSMESIKEEAVALVQKAGASVSSSDKLDDILDAISHAISNMQAQSANDPQKASQVAQYQADYQSLCQSVSDIQSSAQDSSVQSASNQIQSGMNALATYNMASISITNNGNLKF